MNLFQACIAISVIGLGKEADSGGDFLKEVAALGKGRIFFNENPADLLALFESAIRSLPSWQTEVDWGLRPRKGRHID